MGGASRRAAPPFRKVVSWLSKVFALNSTGFNWQRGVLFLDVALVPLVVFWAIGYEQYLFSALFGLLFSWLLDPGGGYMNRAWRTGVFALIGAGLTALGFGIGGEAWGWLVLAAFAVTLAAGLAAVFGARRFIAALLLNVWFILALGLAVSLHHYARITSYTWAQAAAWAGGSALWIVMTFIGWLICGRSGSKARQVSLPARPRSQSGPSRTTLRPGSTSPPSTMGALRSS